VELYVYCPCVPSSHTKYYFAKKKCVIQRSATSAVRLLVLKKVYFNSNNHWTFLGQTAASRCEVFPTFWKLTPSPSSGCAGGLVAPKLMNSCPTVSRTEIHTAQIWTPVIGFGATKLSAHPEDGNGVSLRNVGKPSHLDAAVCQSKFH